MTRKLATLYVGVLVSLAFVLSPLAHADGYRKGKRIRHYNPPHHVEDKVCLAPVRGVGEQWIGEEGAMDAARKDFMQRVRYDFGEAFLDMNNAEDVKSRCGRTSVGQVAGQTLHRCEILARPCKSKFKHGDAK